MYKHCIKKLIEVALVVALKNQNSKGLKEYNKPTLVFFLVEFIYQKKTSLGLLYTKSIDMNARTKVERMFLIYLEMSHG